MSAGSSLRADKSFRLGSLKDACARRVFAFHLVASSKLAGVDSAGLENSVVGLHRCTMNSFTQCPCKSLVLPEMVRNVFRKFPGIEVTFLREC